MSGLLRLLPASEVPAARREAREDFTARYLRETGQEPCSACCERWWPE